jgi:uncharacterized membrane protein YGL010W
MGLVTRMLRPRKSLRGYLAEYEREHTQLGTKITHMIGIPMIVASIPTAFVSPPAAGVLFVGGWAFQLVGHYVFEKNNPSFLHDGYYLLVGPIWVALEVAQLLGLPIPEALTPEREAALRTDGSPEAVPAAN